MKQFYITHKYILMYLKKKLLIYTNILYRLNIQKCNM